VATCGHITCPGPPSLIHWEYAVPLAGIRRTAGGNPPYRWRQADWLARPITLADDIGRAKPGPVPLLRREFSLSAAVASARLYVTALGLHQVAINGHPVSDELLEPAGRATVTGLAPGRPVADRGL
jgi:hypothetical protein